MTRALTVLAVGWFAIACASARPPLSLARDADASHAAAMLHALPDRDTYDPERAAELLQAFLDRFPTDRRAADVRDRLALVSEIVALRAELRALKAIDLARRPRESRHER